MSALGLTVGAALCDVFLPLSHVSIRIQESLLNAVPIAPPLSALLFEAGRAAHDRYGSAPR